MKRKQEELSARLANIPEVEADAIDRAMLEQAQAVDDGTTTSLEEIKDASEFSGKLNIRIPKSLHCKLSQEAKKDGVSLNQYIIYKLAR